jgi:hypothetical protein
LPNLWNQGFAGGDWLQNIHSKELGCKFFEINILPGGG